MGKESARFVDGNTHHQKAARSLTLEVLNVPFRSHQFVWSRSSVGRASVSRRVRQSTEMRMLEKQTVGGSSPSGPTKFGFVL